MDMAGYPVPHRMLTAACLHAPAPALLSRQVDKLRNHLEGLLARTSAESDSVYSAATISADAVLILQQSIGHEVKQVGGAPHCDCLAWRLRMPLRAPAGCAPAGRPQPLA
jgi:hypothetical protein